MPNTVNVAEFRSHLPKYLAYANAGNLLRITSRGKEIAELSPPRAKPQSAKEKLLTLRAKASIGDVVSPIGDAWDALK